MEFLRKLQAKPLKTKKLILWTIIIILGLVLGFWWVKKTAERFEEFSKGGLADPIQFPSFEEQLQDIPSGQIEEELENILNEAFTEQSTSSEDEQGVVE